MAFLICNPHKITCLQITRQTNFILGSKPKTLQEIFRDYSHKLPVNAYFDKLPKWSFKAGKKTKSNLKYGGVEILSLYTEIFMKGMPIHNGESFIVH